VGADVLPLIILLLAIILLTLALHVHYRNLNDLLLEWIRFSLLVVISNGIVCFARASL